MDLNSIRDVKKRLIAVAAALALLTIERKAGQGVRTGLVVGDRVARAVFQLFNAVFLRFRRLIVEAAVTRDGRGGRGRQPDAAVFSRRRLRIAHADIVPDRVAPAVPSLNAIAAIRLAQVAFDDVVLVAIMPQIADAVSAVADKLVALHVHALNTGAEKQTIGQVLTGDGVAEFAIA